tara:strand:+ start:2998 stop:3822 length:825 start_codon:yes stop_codon:yes gene_type:complete
MEDYYAYGPAQRDPAIVLNDASGFEGMRVAGKLAAETLDYITPYVVPGAVTADLDAKIQEYVESNGAKSATIGYKGYQHASCISVNHVVCHGIPGDKILQDGDIVNIDVTVIIDGWHGDTSRMFFVGDKISTKARLLVEATYDCLMRGIDVVRPGATLGDIGHAIQSYAEKKRFSVVRDFCGHGIGKVFHCPPSVLHYGEPNSGTILEEGMFFTIEPMINAGKFPVKILSDGWTAVTKDKSLSAQFEHSLGVTSDGFEIFTLSPAGHTCPPYKV